MNNIPTPAGFWIRVAAAFIDGLIFMPLFILQFMDLLWWKSFFLILVLSIPTLFYKPLMETYKGATLGKMACGLRVIDEEGNNLTLQAAYMRYLPQLMALFVGLFGYVLLFANPEFIKITSLLELAQFRQPNSSGLVQMAVNCFVLVDGLMVAFTYRKRAIHDMLAHSYCIKVNQSMQIQNTAEDVATYCEKCSKEIPHDVNVCPFCGAIFHE